eukprot:gene25529-30823_t
MPLMSLTSTFQHSESSSPPQPTRIDLRYIVNTKPLSNEEVSQLRNWSSTPTISFLVRKPALDRASVRQALQSYSENKYGVMVINNESDFLAYGIIKALMLIMAVAAVAVIASRSPY